VILVDANVLIYASNQSSPRNAKACDWLNGQINGLARVGLPWPVLLAFLRLATNRHAFPNPLTSEQAWRQVSHWLAHEPVWIPTPTERHAAILGEFLALPGVHGNLVSDAHLAALAIEHGLTLCSTDGDFARFPRLRWYDPLAA